MLRLLFCTAIEGDVKALSLAARELGERIRVRAYTRRDLQLKGEKELLEEAAGSHFIFFHLMGGPESMPHFKAVVELAHQKGLPLHVQPTAAEEDESLRRISTIGGEEYDLVRRYVSYGGKENFKALLEWCCWKAGLGSALPPPPRPLPWEGIYHPRHGSCLEPEAFWEKVSLEKPLVALLFYQSWWVAGNLEFVDALVKALEKRGAEVLPVFLYASANAALGSRGIAWVVENLHYRGGRPAVDAVISALMFSQTQPTPTFARPAPENFYLRLGVPVIKAIAAITPRERWAASSQGLEPLDVIMSMALPEFDGQLITVPVAFREELERDPVTGGTLVLYKPDPERVDKVAALACNWVRLRRTPPAERKVAVILHNYPPRNDRIGCAFGLDTPESLYRLLCRLKEAGYRVENLPPDASSLFRSLLEGLTNDANWSPPETRRERAAARVPLARLENWLAPLSPSVRKELAASWGSPPGKVMTWNQETLIPGRFFGHIFVGLQPPRGFETQLEAAYHDPDLPPPYQYLAFYRWLEEDFGAHVVLHLGKHGTLEWLPGKGSGLSASCYPDLALDRLPNVYPYIVNDPGEGTQAKRRSWACIVDHLVPAMTSAGKYEHLEALETLCREYQEALHLDPPRLPRIKEAIWAKVKESHLDRDLEVTGEDEQDFDSFLERLHAYLHEVGDSLIREGLHILGQPPEGDKLVHFLGALCRLPHGELPALREAVAEALGFSYRELEDNPSRWYPELRTTAAALLDRVEEKTEECLRLLVQAGFDPAACPGIVAQVLGREEEQLVRVLEFVAREVWPRLEGVREEIEACLAGLSGRYVPPGPSGAPTRGRLDVLPTGRNFYSVDPQALPTRAAWEVGKQLADLFLARYLAERGAYPENVGMVIWATSEMRTGGENIAQALYLMGVRPVWEEATGRVRGLELIPREELRRPRLDVTLRVSGLFRDTFLNIIHLLDDAVRRVAEQEEGDNLLRRHFLAEVSSALARGVKEEEAREEALFRIFSDPPGAYGAGVNHVIDESNWKDAQDLAQVYLTWGGYAYGRRFYAREAKEAFARRLARLEATIKNEDSREIDIFDDDCFYAYHGGMIAAARSLGANPMSFVGDSSDPLKVKVRTLLEESRRLFRARVLNPKYIRGMQEHGFKGAGDLSRMVDYIFGWSATAQAIEDWMYEGLAEKYVLDPEVAGWMKEVNPWALHNILAKLLEAISRGLWRPAPELEEKLKNLYLEVEGLLEERS
ncbi:cobaltochelatase subunit CobN [Desulfothermobacter acidiphilus]|uniref:cobaltochelatase subunit CobN n=1 Tax=Desulfothermobacter acidiphilus TaxID=1938353 RepID=UPI003F8CB040